MIIELLTEFCYKSKNHYLHTDFLYFEYLFDNITEK